MMRSESGKNGVVSLRDSCIKIKSLVCMENGNQLHHLFISFDNKSSSIQQQIQLSFYIKSS